MPKLNPTPIDPLSDHLLTVDDIVERVAKITGMRRPHRGTVLRWMFSGVEGVRLQSVKLSGQRFSTEACLRQFFQRQNGAGHSPEAESTRSKEANHKRQAAKLKLAKAGI
jgi:hypothetical protein